MSIKFVRVDDNDRFNFKGHWGEPIFGFWREKTLFLLTQVNPSRFYLFIYEVEVEVEVEAEKEKIIDIYLIYLLLPHDWCIVYGSLFIQQIYFGLIWIFLFLTFWSYLDYSICIESFLFMPINDALLYY